MVKIKDTKQAINKLAKKIKTAAAQLKIMRTELKQLKEKAKSEAAMPDKAAGNKKANAKKQIGRKAKKPATRNTKVAK